MCSLTMAATSLISLVLNLSLSNTLSTTAAPSSGCPKKRIRPFSSKVLVSGLAISCSNAANFSSDLRVLPLLTGRSKYAAVASVQGTSARIFRFWYSQTPSCRMKSTALTVLRECSKTSQWCSFGWATPFSCCNSGINPVNNPHFSISAKTCPPCEASSRRKSSSLTRSPGTDVISGAARTISGSALLSMVKSSSAAMRTALKRRTGSSRNAAAVTILIIPRSKSSRPPKGSSSRAFRFLEVS